MIIMSVDLGLSRTGIAVCDKFELLASPVEVIFEKNRKILIKKIVSLISSLKAELLVVGLPKNMDGSCGESSKRAYAFCEEIKNFTNIKTEFWDERLSTVSANEYLNKTNTRGEKRKKVIDAVSAVIILQNYLDYRKNSTRIKNS